MQTTIPVTVHGSIKIVDKGTGEILVEKNNAVHPENMARIIARALSNEANGCLHYLSLGNGGTYFNSGGQIVYKSPNILGSTSDLYNETYSEIVDETNGGEAGNSVYSQASPSPLTTYQVVTIMELDATQPSGQFVTDATNTDPESLYMFDELGLKAEDGALLTHVVFSPIEKTANRAITITYTLTISVN